MTRRPHLVRATPARMVGIRSLAHGLGRWLARAAAPGLEPDAPAAELVTVLGSLASYNDKGHLWRRDDAVAQAAFRAAGQARLLALAGALGEPALDQELLAALVSGAAAGDDSGRYVELAQRRFGQSGP